MNRHALWLGAALACAGAMMSCLGDDTVGTSPAIDGGNDGTSRADGGPGDASIDVGPEETSGIDAGPADVALDVCCAPDEGHPPLGAPVFTP
ncbi:MAG TPA: hypothetical protein VIF15_13485, partial [Polyangiaceae bacterium]